jgi:hypothetical protein
VDSPDGRLTAFADKRGIGVTSRKTSRTRFLTRDTGFNLAWSPDSGSIAYIAGFMHFGTSSTGDLRVVTLAGQARTIVARGSEHGGGFVSVSWTRAPTTVRYRKPARTGGAYAGGEVARLAADDTQVAFAACNSVYGWTPPSTSIRLVDGNPFGGPLCFPPTDRVEVYDLAVSAERVAFGRAGGGLTAPLELRASPLSTPAPNLLTRGGTSVGGHMRGVGTLAGADGLLVYSSWDGRPAGNSSSDAIVSTQSIFRVDSTACPCPAIASVPALGTPVDVDEGRVVVVHAFWPDGTWASRTPSLALLDRTGTQLLSIPIDAVAAQLDGNDLVAAVGGTLVRFDAVTGELIHSWQVSTQGPARDCLFWAGPDCMGLVYGAQPQYVLQDVARGLVSYTLDGQVRLLRLSDGADSVVGFGRLARFLDTGLVYADGARIHFVPFGKLPLS